MNVTGDPNRTFGNRMREENVGTFDQHNWNPKLCVLLKLSSLQQNFNLVSNHSDSGATLKVAGGLTINPKWGAENTLFPVTLQFSKEW